MTRKKILFYINFDRSFTGGPRVVYNLVSKIDMERFHPVVVTNKPSELTEKLASLNREFVILEQHRAIGEDDGDAVRGGIVKRLSAMRHVLGYNRRFQTILNQHKCDVLWVRNIKGVLLTGVAARRSKVPLIWDIGMEKTSRGFMRLLHNVGFRLATKVITEGKCVATSIFTPSPVSYTHLTLPTTPYV